LREDVLAGLMGEVQQHMETICILKTELEEVALKSADSRRFYEEQVCHLTVSVVLWWSTLTLPF
jgi:FtsZ-binding cell division protein ZapB